MTKVIKGIIGQLMNSLEELPDTYSVEQISTTKYKVTVFEPSMVGGDEEEPDEGDDDGEKSEEYIVELKVTKVE